MAKVPVHELRKLVLPLETAVDAVLELDSEQGGSLAFGAILEAKIESGPEAGLALVVQRRGSESTEQRKFTLAILAAAFIRYCWKCRIPLPRAGSKRIEIAPEGFVFTIEGTVEVIRRHGPLPQQPSAGRRPASPDAAPSSAAQASASSAGPPLSAVPAPSPAQQAEAAQAQAASPAGKASAAAPPAQPQTNPAPEQAVA
jgi:hypothetical protein